MKSKVLIVAVLTAFAFLINHELSSVLFAMATSILFFIVNDLLVKGYKKVYALLAYLGSTAICVVSYVLSKDPDIILLYLLFTAFVLVNYLVRHCISKKAAQAG